MSDLLPEVPKPGSLVSATQMAIIEERVFANVDAIDDRDTLDHWRSSARAIESYLRDKELQRPILGAERRVEARIGKLLGPAVVGSHHSVTTEGATLAKDDRLDFRILGDFAEHQRANGGIEPEAWRYSRRAMVARARAVLGLLPDTPELPAGTFSCVVADPPWQLDTGPDTWGGTGERGHEALAYSTMSVAAIEALPVESRAAADTHLFLWTTNRYVEAAYGVARAWGFTPSVLLVWAKHPRGVGLGDTFRLTTEFILYARRGSPASLGIVPRSWFDWPRSTHSTKPAGFYELVESITQGPRLEMFARAARPGWTTWGNEVAA